MDIAELLKKDIGKDKVLARGDGRVSDYAIDESGLGPFPPDAVALCHSNEDIVAVLRRCSELNIPITPRGAGSGKVGGALPVRGGVVLSTEHMTRISEVNSDDFLVVAQPGVITGHIDDVLSQDNLFYPPDPASLDYCSIGGNVACNAGGPRAFKYGVTKDHVLGLQVILVNGEILNIGRRTSKGVSGYDMVSHFVGSEGSFGIISEVTLKCLPRPPSQMTALAHFPSLEKAGEAINALLKCGVRPRALEIMDSIAIEHVRPMAPNLLPNKSNSCALIELDGHHESLEAQMNTTDTICQRFGCNDLMVAMDEKQRRAMWAARRSISGALKNSFATKISEDICVPRGHMTEMIKRIHRIGESNKLNMACYGHAGDGNLHVNILSNTPKKELTKDEQTRISQAVTTLFEETIALGGTLSGEHGIGLTKKSYMGLEHSEASLRWQHKLKEFWDPKRLLNPGKVLPAGGTGCHE